MFVRKESLSKLLLVCFAVGFTLSGNNDLEAQLFAKAKAEFAKIKADFSNDSPIQYSPSDPATKSRLFNLQTGQAGAFYNCDGEEDKRNSPYICWKTGHGARFHRTFWDVKNWKKDKAEIAQRICDGAGACCSGGGSYQQPSYEIVEPVQSTCGCAGCVTKSGNRVAPLSATSQVAVGAANAKSGLLSQLETRVAGIVETRDVARSVVDSPGVVEEVPCDCYSCRMERQNGTANRQMTREPSTLSR